MILWFDWSISLHLFCEWFTPPPHYRSCASAGWSKCMSIINCVFIIKADEHNLVFPTNSPIVVIRFKFLENLKQFVSNFRNYLLFETNCFKFRKFETICFKFSKFPENWNDLFQISRNLKFFVSKFPAFTTIFSQNVQILRYLKLLSFHFYLKMFNFQFSRNGAEA